MRHTSERADIIAVVDADYVVDRNWLAQTLPAFDQPQVALVQSPQEHRDGHGSWFNNAMNVEYGGFFDVGMVQRNEHDAIVAHGTMVLIRRLAMVRPKPTVAPTAISLHCRLGALVSSFAWVRANRFGVTDIDLFAIVLAVQAIPYVAAALVGLSTASPARLSRPSEAAARAQLRAESLR